jgi:hypothetical protein
MQSSGSDSFPDYGTDSQRKVLGPKVQSLINGSGWFQGCDIDLSHMVSGLTHWWSPLSLEVIPRQLD